MSDKIMKSFAKEFGTAFQLQVITIAKYFDSEPLRDDLTADELFRWAFITAAKSGALSAASMRAKFQVGWKWGEIVAWRDRPEVLTWLSKYSAEDVHLIEPEEEDEDEDENENEYDEDDSDNEECQCDACRLERGEIEHPRWMPDL